MNSNWYSRLFFAAIATAIVFNLNSCGKDDSPPPEPPPHPDSLGTGWQKIKVNEANGLEDVFFVNNNVGWVCGKYVHKSTDGGLTWIKQQVGADSVHYRNLFFVDELQGYAAGSNALYRTKNGGATWQEIKISGVVPWDVQFINHSLGFLIGGSGLYRSQDSGSTWTKIPSNVATGSTLYFFDALRGWVYDGSKSAYTSNGGYDFSIKNSLAGYGIYAMQFIDTTYGWLAGADGIWRTNNSGQTYTPVTQPVGGDIHFFNKNDGFICFGDGVFSTSNGGQTLTKVVKLMSLPGFVELYFTNMTHGWAVNNFDHVFRYAQ